MSKSNQILKGSLHGSNNCILVSNCSDGKIILYCYPYDELKKQREVVKYPFDIGVWKLKKLKNKSFTIL